MLYRHSIEKDAELLKTLMINRINHLAVNGEASYNRLDLSHWDCSGIDFTILIDQLLRMYTNKNYIYKNIWAYAFIKNSNFANTILYNFDFDHTCINRTNFTESALPNMKNCDAINANFSYVDADGKIFENCDFSHVTFYNANLIDVSAINCKFFCVDFEFANLKAATLDSLKSAKNIVSLSFDPRDYIFYAVKCGQEIMIYAGCRRFSEEKAIVHWGSVSYPDTKRGANYLAAIQFAKLILVN